MEENTVINNTSFTNYLDKYFVVKDKNGNLIPFNNWSSKHSIKNNIKNSPYYSYLTFDAEEVIKQVRIDTAIKDLENCGLI